MTLTLKALPAQYAKFLTAAAGQALVYLQLYGATWHLVPALTAIAASLGVAAVPNAPRPAAAVLAAPVATPAASSNVTLQP